MRYFPLPSRFTFSRVLLASASMALLLLASAETGPGGLGSERIDLKLKEGGFRVDLFDQCRWAGQRPRQPFPDAPRPIPPVLRDMECGHGAWGDQLYLLYTGGQDLDETFPFIARMDDEGQVTMFAAFDLSNYRAYDMSIAPEGWREGDEIFVSAWPWDVRLEPAMIVTVNPAGDQGVQAAGDNRWTIGSAAADPTGAFGGDLFYSFGPVVVRQDGSGQSTFFIQNNTWGDMRFGPGGNWDTDLHIRNLSIAPDGSVIQNPSGFTEFTWTEGGRFDGDAFGYSYVTRSIYRIRPDWTSTEFAANAEAPIVYCRDALWVNSPEGCLRITPRGR